MNRYLSRCQPSSDKWLVACWRGSGFVSGRSGSNYCQRAGAVALLGYLTIGVLLPAHSQTPSRSPSAQPTTQPTAADETRPTLKLGSQGTAVSDLQAILKLLGYYTGSINGLYQESTAEAVSTFQRAAGLQPDGIAGTETWNRLLPLAPAVSQTAEQTPVQPTAQSSRPTTTPSPTPNRASSTPTPSPSSTFPTPTASATPTPTTPRTPAPVAPTQPTSESTGYTPITPTPTPAPPPTTTATAPLPILRIGMTGADVTRLQERLKDVGFFSGAVDGVFGSETEAAVQQAQRTYNLEPDGVVGPATWEALLQGN